MSKKVLMLHGLAQSGPYFESKTKGLRTELENAGYTLFYPTAPNEYSPADVPDSLSQVVDSSHMGKVIAWLESDPANNTYRMPETTIQYLHDYVLENGPFQGVIGFSQGATVAGYLMTDFNALLRLTKEEQPPLKFFISFSGQRLRPPQFQEQYDTHSITTPSLHVQGELDTVTEASQVEALYHCCTENNRTFLTHPGGHYVPNSRGFSRKVVAWLATLN